MQCGTEFLGHNSSLNHGHARSAELLRYQNPGGAKVGQPTPHLAVVPVGSSSMAAHGLSRLPFQPEKRRTVSSSAACSSVSSRFRARQAEDPRRGDALVYLSCAARDCEGTRRQSDGPTTVGAHRARRTPTRPTPGGLGPHALG